jgi:putative aminopeptidase FrvX
MKQELIKTLSIQTSSYNQFRMFAYIIRELNKIGCNYYTYNGCIYATKGSALNYNCMVSHMDTVHDICEDLTVLEINGNLTGFNCNTLTQTGIGGDDKVGVFITLQCLKHFDNFKAVFFRDEEVGCEGSYDSDIEFFDDCNYVLQCDRRGNGDFITSASGVELSSIEFQNDIINTISKYGYKFNVGMMTDVMALKQNSISISMANISCGYYNPHQDNEYVNIKDVFNCLDMCIEIYTSIDNTYLHEHKTKVMQWEIDSKRMFLDDELDSCELCSKKDSVSYSTYYGLMLCNKCEGENNKQRTNYSYFDDDFIGF